MEKILNAYDWVEWKNRKHNTTTAHAIDPDSEERTGVERSVNGSVIGEDAVTAKKSTPRDQFCVHIIMSRHAREEAKAEKAAAREEARAEKAKKAKKAKGKTTKKKAAKGSNAMRNTLFSTKGGKLLRSDEGNVNVHIFGKFVKVLDGKKCGKAPELRITTKSWAVYSKGKRVGFGRL